MKEESGIQVPLSISEHDGFREVAVGVDEYMEVGYVFDHGQPTFYHLNTGETIPVPSQSIFDKTAIEQVVRSGTKGHEFALSTKDGVVYPVTIQFNVQYRDTGRSVHPELLVETPIRIIPQDTRLRKFAYQVTEKGGVICSCDGIREGLDYQG